MIVKSGVPGSARPLSMNFSVYAVEYSAWMAVWNSSLSSRRPRPSTIRKARPGTPMTSMRPARRLQSCFNSFLRSTSSTAIPPAEPPHGRDVEQRQP
jgi:hypothetical protein